MVCQPCLVNFEISHLDGIDEGIDLVLHDLQEVRLECPFRGALFRPVVRPFCVRLDGMRAIVFARRGTYEALGVVIETGVVVTILSVQGIVYRFANTSIRHFSEIVSVWSKWFPVRGVSDEDDSWDRNAESLRQVIADIDPDSIGPDLFWADLCSDVSVGDWGGDDVDCDKQEPIDWSKHQIDPPPGWYQFQTRMDLPTLDEIREDLTQ